MAKFFGIEFAPLAIPFERRIQTLCVVKFVITFLVGGFGGLALFIGLFFTRFYVISLIYMAWYMLDRLSPYRGGKRVAWFRNWLLWKKAADYFPIKLIKTAELDPNKNYILGYHPHGILGMGGFLHFCTEGTGFSKIFPGITPHLMVLPGHFQFPFYRDYLMTSGILPATKGSMDWALSHGPKGRALGLIVGGALEALEAHAGHYRLKILDRKGFIKIALRNGASLIPVVSFGENNIYEQVANPPGSRLRNFQLWMTRLLGFSPPIFYGRGVFQYSFGILPRRRPVNTVVGRPIDVAQIKEPSLEDIDKLQRRYLDELLALFEKYKVQYGETPECKMEFF
ncbi:2-acylglycerol O-acyltransferase 2-like isoform X1 [Tubulanus polymorphus]|uniref:2-acylglycerol O-acyltransferase 2-like isoform X1 n=1 Tax=Tubulanus polymorphus TaxID=672921 RepID=UPI003DA2E87F